MSRFEAWKKSRFALWLVIVLVGSNGLWMLGELARLAHERASRKDGRSECSALGGTFVSRGSPRGECFVCEPERASARPAAVR